MAVRPGKVDRVLGKEVDVVLPAREGLDRHVVRRLVRAGRLNQPRAGNRDQTDNDQGPAA
jgi:hypothetical protein